MSSRAREPSNKQLDALIDFKMTKKMRGGWDIIADKLNAMGRVKKDGTGWEMYWIQYRKETYSVLYKVGGRDLVKIAKVFEAHPMSEIISNNENKKTCKKKEKIQDSSIQQEKSTRKRVKKNSVNIQKDKKKTIAVSSLSQSVYAIEKAANNNSMSVQNNIIADSSLAPKVDDTENNAIVLDKDDHISDAQPATENSNNAVVVSDYSLAPKVDATEDIAMVLNKNDHISNAQSPTENSKNAPFLTTMEETANTSSLTPVIGEDGQLYYMMMVIEEESETVDLGLVKETTMSFEENIVDNSSLVQNVADEVEICMIPEERTVFLGRELAKENEEESTVENASFTQNDKAEIDTIQGDERVGLMSPEKINENCRDLEEVTIEQKLDDETSQEQLEENCIDLEEVTVEQKLDDETSQEQLEENCMDLEEVTEQKLNDETSQEQLEENCMDLEEVTEQKLDDETSQEQLEENCMDVEEVTEEQKLDDETSQEQLEENCMDLEEVTEEQKLDDEVENCPLLPDECEDPLALQTVKEEVGSEESCDEEEMLTPKRPWLHQRHPNKSYSPRQRQVTNSNLLNRSKVGVAQKIAPLKQSKMRQKISLPNQSIEGQRILPLLKQSKVGQKTSTLKQIKVPQGSFWSQRSKLLQSNASSDQSKVPQDSFWSKKLKLPQSNSPSQQSKLPQSNSPSQQSKLPQSNSPSKQSKVPQSSFWSQRSKVPQTNSSLCVIRNVPLSTKSHLNKARPNSSSLHQSKVVQSNTSSKQSKVPQSRPLSQQSKVIQSSSRSLQSQVSSNSSWLQQSQVLQSKTLSQQSKVSQSKVLQSSAPSLQCQVPPSSSLYQHSEVPQSKVLQSTPPSIQSKLPPNSSLSQQSKVIQSSSRSLQSQVSSTSSCSQQSQVLQSKPLSQQSKVSQSKVLQSSAPSLQSQVPPSSSLYQHSEVPQSKVLQSTPPSIQSKLPPNSSLSQQSEAPQSEIPPPTPPKVFILPVIAQDGSKPNDIQLGRLMKFLEINPSIAQHPMGFPGLPSERRCAMIQWSQEATFLNDLGDTKMDGPGWAKYWQLKKYYLEGSLARVYYGRQPTKKLTPVDTKLLTLVPKDFLTKLSLNAKKVSQDVKDTVEHVKANTEEHIVEEYTVVVNEGIELDKVMKEGKILAEENTIQTKSGSGRRQSEEISPDALKKQAMVAENQQMSQKLSQSRKLSQKFKDAQLRKLKMLQEMTMRRNQGKIPSKASFGAQSSTPLRSPNQQSKMAPNGPLVQQSKMAANRSLVQQSKMTPNRSLVQQSKVSPKKSSDVQRKAQIRDFLVQQTKLLLKKTGKRK